MPDFGSEVMAEALAMAKPVYKIPIIPFSSSSQYRHQDHIDFKDYKTRVGTSYHNEITVYPTTVCS